MAKVAKTKKTVKSKTRKAQKISQKPRATKKSAPKRIAKRPSKSTVKKSVKKVTAAKKPAVVKAEKKTPKRTKSAVQKSSKTMQSSSSRKKPSVTTTSIEQTSTVHLRRRFLQGMRRGPSDLTDWEKSASLENLSSLTIQEEERKEESFVEQSKFDIGLIHDRTFETQELPREYGKDRAILLVVDPRFVFTYWEITPQSLENAKKNLGSQPKLTLRFYDTSDGNTPEESPSWDIEVFDRLGNWYLRLEYPEQKLVIDVGMKDAQGKFYSIARSNDVRLPASKVAPVGPTRWMTVGPDGERVESAVEEYTDMDLGLLQRILGPYFYGLLMSGEFSSIIGSSMESIFQDVAQLKHPELFITSSSPMRWHYGSTKR